MKRRKNNEELKRIKPAIFTNFIKGALVLIVFLMSVLGEVQAQTENNQNSEALNTVNIFFDKFKSGASPEELSNFFDKKAELYIPGDTTNVPWIGKRKGRKEIANHFRLLRKYIKPEKLIFTDMVTKNNRVVILGYLESRMKTNSNVMKSEFSIDIIVEKGLITYYHLLEDSFSVSRAVNQINKK